MQAGTLTFGTVLPSFSSPKHGIQSRTLDRFARIAEDLGYDSLWVIDHFLKAPTYGQTWLDPLLSLAYVAGQTQRVKLGTAVLIVPLRDPVMLAKEIATLQLLSDNRLIFGVGVGWNPIEFESVRVPRHERGRRTDEIIEIVRLLLSNRSATYQGRYYQFPEISIEPLPDQPPPIWVGGGSQAAIIGSSEPGEHVAESVIQRIARSDGWFSSGINPPRLMRADWARIQQAARALGRDPAEITFGHSTVFHIVDTDDRERAYEEQQRVFADYMGDARPWSFVEASYLVGSVSDIVEKIRERAEIGVTYFRLGPIIADPGEMQRQLELLANRIIPNLE